MAASRATSVPERPIATPMSARRSAGASLTPSPVMATTWPMRAQRVGDAQLGLRRAAREHHLGPQPSSSSSSRSVIASSSVPLTTCIPPAPMPTRRAIVAAVSPLSPVTTCTRIPARCTRSIAAGTSGRGGSSIATSPIRHSSRSASSRWPGTAAPAGSVAVGDREHPQALAARSRPSIRPTVARSAAVIGRSPGPRRIRAHPGQHLLRRALGVDHQAAVLLVDGRHELEPRIEAEYPAPARPPGGRRDIQAAARPPARAARPRSGRPPPGPRRSPPARRCCRRTRPRRSRRGPRP